MLRLGLVGDPVAHSLSPALHEAALLALGIEGDYSLVQVPEGQLPTRWEELGERFSGLNFTTPHKRAALRLAGSLSVAAQTCASVNTVVFRNGDSFGDSTDGRGFLAALGRVVGFVPERAVILGTGGGARAVAAALAAEGRQVVVLGHNLDAGTELVAELSGTGPGTVGFGGDGDRALTESLAGAGLLVNATPLGGPRFPDACPVSEAVRLSPELVVFDLAYWPKVSPLRRRAEAAGCHFVDGLEMLVEQGALSFRAFTGAAPPLDVMRQAAWAAREERT